ncbi:hypothetical protein MBLNU459_g1231t1 [Dothideomycetes sp. NU459]
MVFVKPTIGISRLAGAAYKTFTHGHTAQTVVAASQSSYASQNTRVGPSYILERVNGKGNKAQFHNVAHHPQTGVALKPDFTQHESDLAQYYESWQKHQKTGDVREWNQFQFPKRIGYTAEGGEAQEQGSRDSAAIEEVDEDVESLRERQGVKRSYTTSAVDNFGKAIDDERAEAIALAQVNEAIAEEITRAKQEAEAAAGLDRSPIEDDAASERTITPASEGLSSSTSNRTLASDATSATSVSELDVYAQELNELLRTQQYARIPGVFESMLRNGVKQPAPLAYRALMTSAIELTRGKHQKVPRALEVYSDMLRRRVLPDAETYTALVNVLAGRALEASSTQEILEEKRRRYGGLDTKETFLFRSDELEYAIFSEDQSLSIALTAFNTASSTMTFSSESYGLLIVACAKQSRIPDMLRLYEQMDAKKLTPQAIVFPAMISAFAAVGDLRSAVGRYDDYKELAIANDAGMNEMTRMDTEVYAALIKAYASCDHLSGGQKFLSQIESEQTDAPTRQAVRDNILVQAILPVSLKAGNYSDAFGLITRISPAAMSRALNTISIATADADNLGASTKAFSILAGTEADLAPSAMAMLAMHVRNANLDAAEPYWRVLESSSATPSFIEPSTMRAIAMISVGQAARGIQQTRQMLNKIREASTVDSSTYELVERIEEAIEVLGHFTIKAGLPQIEASIELLRMMVDNGALVDPIAEHLVASFGPEQISQLASVDVGLLTMVQARMILDESAPEIAGPARFAFLLDNIVSRSIVPDVSTENLIEKTLINIDRSDLSRLWNSYRYPAASANNAQYPAPAQFSPFLQPPPMMVQPAFDESFDPYAGRTDNKGSVAITDLLEKPYGKSSSHLNEALTKFRNIRRAGRHPRFFAYAKLITAAAKDNQLSIAHDILEMAKQDVPFTPQYRVVRYGWVTILDSMVAGCLVVGRRDLAAKYHQDLLDMGAAPTANTYGLYITTLKENTKTFDEATEAVKIFLRAKAEGVEPTSFLYNALIGKLGKARRIDDCLFYFAEMRNLMIKPTSVTYGTIVNALCRVSDEKFAEEIFEEMESCANYKPRPAPYHSLMQYFLTTKRDRSKVLSYYERMRSKGIQPTMHTYKLLIDTHATLDPVDMTAAEAVLESMRASGAQPEAVHFASLIHAKGCVLHDMAGARALFDSVISDHRIRLQPCIYQAIFESLVANRHVADAEALLADMTVRRVEMTPYIANALIHGWTQEKDIVRAKHAFDRVRLADREPSTYEAMVRAYLAVEDREGANVVVGEALSRGYPAAVAGKIAELIGGGRPHA